jgi:hypothetical protein
MNAWSGRRNSGLLLLSVFTALLYACTPARAQFLFCQDWAEHFNNSVTTEPEDNWVANSYICSNADRQHLLSVSFPIDATFTNQPISVFIYQGFDLNDPTAGGGLVLLSQTNATITTDVGDIVTIPLNPDVFLNVGDIFYAAVLIPGVPGNKFPFRSDRAGGSTSRNLPDKGTKPFGRSFFDVGQGPFDPANGAGPFDVNKQVFSNITVFGGVHPLMGGNPGDVQSPGNLALWVKATHP